MGILVDVVGGGSDPAEPEMAWTAVAVFADD